MSTAEDQADWLTEARLVIVESVRKGEFLSDGRIQRAVDNIDTVIAHLRERVSEHHSPLQVPESEWPRRFQERPKREGHMTDAVEAASFNRREAMRLAIDTFGGPITSVQIGILADRAREILQFIEEP